MFYPTPLDDSELSLTQLTRKQKIAGLSTTASIELIKMRQVHQVQQNGIVTVTLSASSIPYSFKAKYINAPDTSDYVWSGDLVSYGGDTTGIDTTFGSLLVISKQNRIFGELVIDTNTYSIKNLGEGLNALVRQKTPDGSTECSMISSQSPNGLEENAVGKNYPACPVRVLVLFTQAALDNNPDILDMIDIAFENTRNILTNSKIFDNLLEIQLVGTALLETTDWVETGNENVDRQTISTDLDILAARTTFEADIVMIMTDEVYASVAGAVTAIGETEADVGSAFAFVEAPFAGNPGNTFAHEFAHLFGAHHEGTDICFNDGDDTGLAFAHGFIIEKGCNCWIFGKKRHYRTAMAVCVNNIYPRIPYFSNPDVKYKKKSLGIEGANDNARRIRGAACRVADYMDSELPVLIVNGRREACPGTNITLQAQLWYFPEPWDFEWRISTDGFTWGPVISYSEYCSVTMPSVEGEFVYVQVIISSENSNETIERIIPLKAVFVEGCPIEFTIYNNPEIVATSIQSPPLREISQLNSEYNEENALSVKVFPNPTNGILNIEIRNPEIHVAEIRLRNLLGKTVILNRYIFNNNLDVTGIELSTQNLSSGIYWLTIESGKFQKTICISVLR